MPWMVARHAGGRAAGVPASLAGIPRVGVPTRPPPGLEAAAGPNRRRRARRGGGQRRAMAGRKRPAAGSAPGPVVRGAPMPPPNLRRALRRPPSTACPPPPAPRRRGAGRWGRGARGQEDGRRASPAAAVLAPLRVMPGRGRRWPPGWGGEGRRPTGDTMVELGKKGRRGMTSGLHLADQFFRVEERDRWRGCWISHSLTSFLFVYLII